MEVCKSEGRMTDLAFATPSSDLATPGDDDAFFWKYIYAVQACTDLIDKKVNVYFYFSLNRRPRRSVLMQFK